MNIYFALHEFGRMKLLLGLQDLYKEEKTLNHKMEVYPKNMVKYQRQ